MKIVHIESGLGNQMLSYCEYLALKKMNPEEEIFIENIIYEIPECNDVICQWNGYELERIFGIKAPNISTLFSDDTWNKIIDEIKMTEFWKKNWNYPVYFTQAFNNAGLYVKNIRGNFEEKYFAAKFSGKKSIKSYFVDSYPGDFLKRIYYKVTEKKHLAFIDNRKHLFLKTDDDCFTGQRLSFKYRNNGIEQIADDIQSSFHFPDFSNPKDLEMKNILEKCNTVAIHARRGDMLGFNGACYKYGYFKRAVRYIRKHVENPVFVFFCDPGSVEWCKQNADIFNLDFSRDKVYFVDWNKGTDSFRDMQLMSCCKHAIITNSSFGWWGAYLIKNKIKITISPDITINTTYHC